MTNTERDKAIWEALGHCWHIRTLINGPTHCKLCNQTNTFNPNLTSDAGKVLLLREVMKLDDFYLFRRYIVDRCLGGDDETDYFLTYITDTTGKLMNEVFDWMVATGRISGIG
jgi:hypothetical protein